jgi:hypothetical protein
VSVLTQLLACPYCKEIPMSDLEEFADLDYPGRRKPKNRQPEQASTEVNIWDDKPLHYLVNGEKREFFIIGHLAKALDYSVQSIRAWEDKGLLPRSPYRSPRTRKPVAGGRSDKGKRLWTREQVEGILALARKHKVILNKKPPTPAFAKEVAKMFHDLTSK